MEYKTMSKICYTIAVPRNDALHVYDYEQQLGYYAFKLWNFNFGVGKRDGLWTVTELISGRSVAWGDTRAKAIEKAHKVLEEVGEDQTARCVSMAIQLELA